MQLKLKESPREWQKFTLVMAVLVSIISYGLYRRHLIPMFLLTAELLAVGVALILCVIWPQWFRRFYRGGMTVSFHIGQFMGKVLLTLFFLLVVTPLGWLLRLMGKDLLNLKRNPSATTYWQPAKNSQELERMF